MPAKKRPSSEAAVREIRRRREETLCREQGHQNETTYIASHGIGPPSRSIEPRNESTTATPQGR